MLGKHLKTARTNFSDGVEKLAGEQPGFVAIHVTIVHTEGFSIVADPIASSLLTLDLGLHLWDGAIRLSLAEWNHPKRHMAALGRLKTRFRNILMIPVVVQGGMALTLGMQR